MSFLRECEWWKKEKDQGLRVGFGTQTLGDWGENEELAEETEKKCPITYKNQNIMESWKSSEDTVSRRMEWSPVPKGPDGLRWE